MSKSRKIAAKPINKPYTRPTAVAKPARKKPSGQEIVLEQSGACPYWGYSSNMFKQAQTANPTSGLAFIKEFESKMLNDKYIIPKGLNIIYGPSFLNDVTDTQVLNARSFPLRRL